MSTLFQLLACLGVPLLLLLTEKRIKIVSWLGPVIFCYLIGILLGNLFFPELGPAIMDDDPSNDPITKFLADVSAVLAVPLVLFSADLKKWLKLAPKTLMSFGFCVIAAVVSTLVAYYVVGDNLGEEGWKVTGMTIGVYTGGTPNLNAIGRGIGASDLLLANANLVDLLVSVPYLFLLFTVAQRVLLLFLPKFESKGSESIENQETGFLDLNWQVKVKNIGISLLLAGACLGIGIGLGALSGLAEDERGGLIITGVTVMGLILSFITPIRKLLGSFEAGEYLLLVFCVAIGLQIRFEILLDNAGSLLDLLGFFAIVVYGALFLHYLLAFLFKIDADTVLITSVAAVFSPVFVPAMAKVLKNREIVASGMTTGVIGFAVGNFVGLAVAYGLRG